MSINNGAGEDRNQLNTALIERSGQLERELGRLRGIQQRLQADEAVLMREIRNQEEAAASAKNSAPEKGT